MSAAGDTVVSLGGRSGRCQHEMVERLVLHRIEDALHKLVVLVLFEEGGVVVFFRVLQRGSEQQQGAMPAVHSASRYSGMSCPIGRRKQLLLFCPQRLSNIKVQS